jgi:hypothetical protein
MWGYYLVLLSNFVAFRTYQFVSVMLNEHDARKESKQQKCERNEMGIETLLEPQIHISAEPTEPAFSI